MLQIVFPVHRISGKALLLNAFHLHAIRQRVIDSRNHRFFFCSSIFVGLIIRWCDTKYHKITNWINEANGACIQMVRSHFYLFFLLWQNIWWLTNLKLCWFNRFSLRQGGCSCVALSYLLAYSSSMWMQVIFRLQGLQVAYWWKAVVHLRSFILPI